MTLHLLDSDATIDYLAGFGPTVALLNRLEAQEDTLCTCAIALAEVYSGFSTADCERHRPFLSSLVFLAESASTAMRAGQWRYAYARQGKPLATTDCLIAAVAHVHGATLVTGNLRDYPMPEVVILPLQRERRGRS